MHKYTKIRAPYFSKGSIILYDFRVLKLRNKGPCSPFSIINYIFLGNFDKIIALKNSIIAVKEFFHNFDFKNEIENNK